MPVTQNQAAALYVAVFNRAPDQAGLNYWIQQNNFTVMAQSFVAHPVFTATYGDLDDQAFIEAIYENVLLGQGDDDGIAFWVGALQAGLSRGEFLASFIDAALAYEGDDTAAQLRKETLVNKVTVGLYYANTLGEASDFPQDSDLDSADIVDSPIYQKAVVAIAAVTADKDTVEAAQSAIDQQLKEAALFSALATYQHSAEQVNQAVETERTAANAANEILDPKVDEDATDFVEQVTNDLAQELELYARDALLVSGIEGAADSLKLNDATIQLVRNKFDTAIKLAQSEVNLLKAQNKSAVNLQEKIQAYNGVANHIEDNYLAYNAESVKFGLLNAPLRGNTPDEKGLNNAEEFAITLKFKLNDKDTQPVSVVLSIDKGQIVVNSPDGNKAVQAFNQFKGVDAYKATVLGLHSNIALQANAQKAIQTALLQALKDAKYQVYDTTAPPDKAVAWSKVGFATDADGGVSLTNATPDGKTYQLQSTLDGNEPIDVGASQPLSFSARAFTIFAPTDYEPPATGEVLFNVGLINNNGVIGLPLLGNEDFAVLGLNDAKTIAAAATASATVVGKLNGLIEGRDAFEAALADYEDVLALQTRLLNATDALEAAEDALATAAEAFAGLGYNLVVAEDGVATGELITNPAEDPNLFVYHTDLKQANHFSGDDVFFFGDKAAALIVLGSDFDAQQGQLGGDNRVLEIFAKQEGSNTILYIEKTAFAGGASTQIENNAGLVNKDLVKIVLTGVQTSELYFDNEFLQLS